MKLQSYLFLLVAILFSFTSIAQEQQKATSIGTADNMYHVPSLASRMNDLIPSVESNKEAGDKRSLRPQVVPGKDPQTKDDYFVRNRHEMEQTKSVLPPLLVFDAVTQNGFPTDPSLAVGPNHVFVVYNTGFIIYDKSGNALTTQLDDNNIFTNSSTCCDLTVSYDNAADRWVLSVLSGTFAGNSFSGLQIAVSDGPNPLTAGWNSYQFNMTTDYQKLSVWSDGYYIAANKFGAEQVHAIERDVMLAGGLAPQILGFPLTGAVAGGGFFAPQAFNVTDANLPAPGGATFVYLQDDAYTGVTSDHLKLWTVDVNWASPGSSTITVEPQIPLTPFISVFDGGAFDALTQPGGIDIDALQAIIMNQAQFRKFPGHNSAVFNFVVDTDAGPGELAGIRWIELRQTGDNQPWTLYQEGTYTAPDGRHAWCGSMAMDINGNIALGYTSMSGPTTPTTVRVSSYFTGRFDGDPLGTMTAAEELIANGSANINTFDRYGDYSKMDVDPSDGLTFWFDMEYMNPTRKNVVGAFKLAPAIDDVGVTSIDAPNSGALTATESIIITINNFGINNIVNPPVQYTINGGPPVVENFSGTINAGASASYTFTSTADLSAPATYTIAAKTNLAGDSNTGNDETTKIVTSGTLMYCMPTANCADFNDGVTMLELVNQDIAVECGTDGYADNTDIIFEFASNDNPYNGVVQMGFSNSAFAIWIDFNDNGVFEGDELIADEFVAVGNSDYNFTVDLSTVTTVATGLHRMRVRGEDLDQAGDYLDPCDDLAFGRTNDYTANVTIDYCAPSATSGCNIDGIKMFVLGTISADDGGDGCNTEPASSPQGYADRTALSTDLSNQAGSNVYTLQAQQNWGGGAGVEALSVWIDFDDSQTFEASERLISGQFFTTSDVLEPFTLTIPLGATLGSHRLRAKAIDTSAEGDILDPCSDFDFGEVQDYTVNIIGTLCAGVAKTWDGANWSPPGAPNMTNPVVIDGSFSTGVAGSNDGNIDACTCQINASLSVQSGAYVKVEADIINDGSLLVEHEGSLVQVDNDASVINNNIVSVTKTTPNMAAQSFMVIGSPMTEETREDVYGSSYIVRNHITANFIPHPDIPLTAENFADDNGDNWLNHAGVLNPGEGYMVFPQPDGTTTGIFNQVYTKETLNNGVFEIPLIFNSAGQNASPNILANPYPSAIDADLFFNDNTAIDVLYFWEHLTAASASYPGYNPENFNMGDISLWSDGALGGVGMMAANGGVIPTKDIASGQGFAVKAASPGITATFNNAMRITGPNDTYRTSRTVERDLIRLTIVNDTYGLGSNLVLGFSEFTTDEFDQGTEVTRLATPVSIYSELDTGEQLAINALGSFQVEDEVHLSFVTMVEELQSYRISIQDLEGDIIENQSIFIIDNELNEITNLRDGDYTFESNGGTFKNRFTVVFENLLGIDNIQWADSDLVILSQPNNQFDISLFTSFDEIASITIYNMLGQKLAFNYLEKQGDHYNYKLDMSYVKAGVYLVKIGDPASKTYRTAKIIVK